MWRNTTRDQSIAVFVAVVVFVVFVLFHKYLWAYLLPVFSYK
jgi:hypothetical protein